MKMHLIRDQLHDIATKLHYRGLTEEAQIIHHLAEATRRRKYLRKKVVGPKDSQKLTPAIKRWMRILRHEQGLSYADIGRITGVTNVGRISEACTGIAP